MTDLKCACGQPLPVTTPGTYRCNSCGKAMVVCAKTRLEPAPVATASPAAIPVAAAAPVPRRQRWFTVAHLALALAVLATVLATVALFGVLLRTPSGSPLERYDMRTPQAALRSVTLMHVRGDTPAQLELEDRKDGGRLAKEKSATLEIKDEETVRGMRVLFFTYTERGVKKHAVSAFEKEAGTDLWLPARTDDLWKINPELGRRIKEWERAAE